MAPHPRRLHDLRGLSLCAGVGGLDLGLHIAEPGYRTVGFVERQAYAAATLVARMEDAALAPAPVWDDLRTFDGRPWRGRVHIVSAGYPCQPFSFSGYRRGRDDPRHLWPDIARIVAEVLPRRVFCENVPGHLNLGFDDVTRQLQDMGYGVAACVVSAAEVGAGHIRERLFILGDADHAQLREPVGVLDLAGWHPPERRAGQGLASVAAPAGDGLEPDVHDAGGERLDGNAVPLFAPGPGDLSSWYQALRSRPELQPAVYGLDHGLADRVERCAAAGNGVVPLAAALAWCALNAALDAQ